ncbi:MAG: hypothetical protein ACQGVK_24380 [Myxococcota bacterium]
MLCALGLSGCTFNTPLPKERTPRLRTAPREFRIAIVGVPTDDELDCAQYDCNHWYRVDVVEPGRLTVRLTRRPGGTGPPLRMLLNPIARPTMARAGAGPGEPLELEADVAAGVYELLVQSGMGREPYTLTLLLDGAAVHQPGTMPEELVP